ncbi:hypothetical protein LEM8419_02872 [Neolewinella maritima]|uniref:SCO family protein n=1 Tax=Neolewinella maritima TaxID=1383882 RepID=A0ABN8F7I4_9BACT|nr:hypothetical protein [Neolewinella maritima]CAH1001957.1 hypothetical protein LEM8419_02872 [Neolewinella maritima]
MARAKKWFGTAIVLFILVGLPAVSFVYLRNGANYRRSAIEAMGDYGKMPSISRLVSIRGEVPKQWQGAMTVVGWLDPTKEEGTRLYGHMLDSLYQQFQDSPNLYFTTIVLAQDPDAAVEDFTTTYNLPASDMLSFLQADERDFAATAEAFQLPLGSYDSPGIQPIVALVDSSLTIVQHYDLARRDEAIGLVQLISLIIPLPAKQDIILDRGREL